MTQERSITLEQSDKSVMPSLLWTIPSANRRPQSFLFVPKELASVLNAIGGYLLAQATAQKAVARMQETTPGRETR